MAKWLGFIYKGVTYPPIPEQLPPEIADSLAKLVEDDLKAQSEQQEEEAG